MKTHRIVALSVSSLLGLAATSADLGRKEILC